MSETVPHCASCGAALPPLAMKCPYCGVVTALHHQQAAQAQHVAAVEAQQRRQKAAATATSSANRALLWGVLSIPCTCVVVPAVVALVLGIRSTMLARSAGEPIPAKAIGAIVAGAFSLVMMVAGWSYSVVINRQVSARRSEVTARADRGAGAVVLDLPTACALVEQRLLEVETEGISPTVLDVVHCDGAFTQTADKATLEDVRFSSGSKSVTMIACFKRGSRWALADFIKGGTCEHPIDPAAASASASAPSAVPPPSAVPAPSPSVAPPSSPSPSHAAPRSLVPGTPRDRSPHAP